MTGDFPNIPISIKHIVLYNNRLSGTLNISINQCPHLELLILSNNTLIGEFPDLSGDNITILSVSDNQLNGHLKFEYLPHKKLGILDLSNNQLSGTFSSSYLHSLNNLSFFEIDNNQFTGSFPIIPPSLNLQTFSISNNHFIGSLPSFQHSYNLFYIWASNNKFSGTIPSLPLNLFELSLYSNQLSGTIPQLNHCETLVKLLLFIITDLLGQSHNFLQVY